MKARIAIAAIVVLLAAGIPALLWWRARQWDDRAIAWPRELPACDGFDFPVGAPDAAGHHDEQPFGTNRYGADELHLGSDWSGKLGDPVTAAATGVVIDARDIGHEWGNIVRVVHGCGVESIYAHLDRIETRVGATVKRGARIGTVGRSADGVHLHFEIRDRPLPLGGGYYDEGEPPDAGYLDPTAYIRAHRPSPPR